MVVQKVVQKVLRTDYYLVEKMEYSLVEWWAETLV